MTLTQLPHTLHTHLTGTDSATDMQHDLKFVKTVFEPSWDDYVELEGCSGCVKVISWPFEVKKVNDQNNYASRGLGKF